MSPKTAAMLLILLLAGIGAHTVAVAGYERLLKDIRSIVRDVVFDSTHSFLLREPPRGEWDE